MGTLKDWIYHNLPVSTVSQAHRDFINTQIQYWQDEAKSLKVQLQIARDANDIFALDYEKQADRLAMVTVEYESLKNKIVERAQVPPIIKAKSAAEIRRVVEQENEREFEEQANGIR